MSSVENIAEPLTPYRVTPDGDNPGSVSRDGSNVDADTAGTVYAVLAIQKKAAFAGDVKISNFHGLTTTNDDGEFFLVRAPTSFAPALPAFVDHPDSQLQVSLPLDNTEVTGGKRLPGFVLEGNNFGKSGGLPIILTGGDVVVLCFIPYSNGSVVNGLINFAEVN